MTYRSDTSRDRGFISRVAKFNKKAERSLHRTFKSTAKKWRTYYSAPADNARFVLYGDKADSSTLAKKLTELLKLGVPAGNIEIRYPEEETNR